MIAPTTEREDRAFQAGYVVGSLLTGFFVLLAAAFLR